MNYIDLKISVGHLSDQTYNIKFESSQGGETAEKSEFPFVNETLEKQLEQISSILYTTGTRFMGRRPEEEKQEAFSGLEIEGFGKALFDFLFQRENLAHFRTLFTQATNEPNSGVRLKLYFEPNANSLSAIPWELMRDSSARGDFLVLDYRIPLVRYINLAQAIQPLKEVETLNILGMISNPLKDLNVKNEKKWVEEALQGLIEAGLVHLQWVDGDEFRDIQSSIRNGDWHVFHYIGHGGYDDERDEGFLVLSDGKDGTRNLYARDLSRIVRSEKLQLVLLNACEGATTDSDELFSSTASTLVIDGIPAVLAMQYPITDTAAIELSRSFYESIADGQPVDYALADARLNIKYSHPDSIEWATPVLFMRSSDGRLINSLKTGQPPSNEDKADGENVVPIDPIIPPLNTPTKRSGTPDGWDENNVLKVRKSKFKDVLEGFTIDELINFCDDLEVPHENLPAKTRDAVAREMIGWLDRRKRLGELVELINEEGREQIWAVLDHLGPLEV